MFPYAFRNMDWIRDPETIYPESQGKKAPDPQHCNNRYGFLYLLSHLIPLYTNLYIGYTLVHYKLSS